MNRRDPGKVSILGPGPRVAASDESEQRSITLYGSPTIGSHAVSGFDELDGLTRDPVHGVLALDGEFVVLAETPDTVVLANDRFASHPLFYLVVSGNLIVSFSYRAIWRWLSVNNRLKPDRLAFYEFLHFQRLFGDVTFDQSTKALPPATVLTFDRNSGNLKLERYWQPDFGKRSDGLKAIAADLADAVRGSLASKTTGASRLSLFLSGGMDARVVLGGFSRHSLPRCVTIGETENNEVDVARALAAVAGAEHSFVERSSGHYEEIVSESTASGGGMYSFQHGHFFGLGIPKTDLILHGHGFDYFFQGMYLPSHRRQVMGRPTRSWALDHVGPDLIGQYVRKVKYRVKGIDAASLLKPGIEAEAMDRIRADLEAVLAPVNGGTSEPYDDWDYLTTSAPGRHYTYLNLLSAGSLSEQRTVAFDNDIFDIYYSTPANIRHGTRLLAETIKHLNPGLLKVRNANTNLRPDLSPARLTIESWSRGVRRRLGIGGNIRPDPGVVDRSWPTDSEIIRTSPTLMSRADRLSRSYNIGLLDVFDAAKIEHLALEFRAGNRQAASALLSMITIDEFISQSS